LGSVSSNITGIIVSSPNYWLLIYDHPLFYFGQVIIGLLSCILIVISSLGAIHNFYENGVTTKMVVLVFETVLNIFALLAIIDLASSRGIYPQLVVTFFFRIAVCLLSMSNLLMGFYFLEVFSDQISSQDSFLRVYKIPFLTITFIVILVNFIMGILASEYIININLNNQIAGAFMSIMNIFALIILVVVLVKCYSITNVGGYLKKIRSVVFSFVIVCIIISLAILALNFLFGTEIYYNTYHIRILSQFSVAGTVLLSSFKIYKLVLVHTIKKSKKQTSKSKSTVSRNNNKKSEQKGEEKEEEKGDKKEEKGEKKNQMTLN
jgi:hypothetical protein